MDLDALLQNLGEDAPSGENLEYDPEFTALELSAQPGEERQAGDEILAAEEPNYKDVSANALAVLARSHDLRAGVFLALAELRLNGLTGFAEVTTYLRRCLEDYWDSCHPQLDADDDNDPTMRVNAVLALADSERILRALRLAPLTDSRSFGRITLRDIAVAEGEIPAPADMTTVLEPASIGAAFQDTDGAALQALLAVARTAADDVQAINAKFDSETPGQGPELDPLAKMLKQIVSRLAEATGTPEASDGEEDAAGTAGPAGAPSEAASGAIASENDVQNALDRIIAYYEKGEPSSPVPILLRRTKRLVGADFMAIMKDIAPSGVDNVKVVGGITDDEY